MTDILSQQQPGSPWYYLKEQRNAERKERDPMQRAMNDYLHRWGGFFVSPNRDFARAVECLRREFDLVPRNPMEI